VECAFGILGGGKKGLTITEAWYNFINSFYYLIELNKNVIQDKYAVDITINIMSTVNFLYEVHV